MISHFNWLLSFFPPARPLLGKLFLKKTPFPKRQTKVFFIALGSISLFLYVRRLRERTKRNEHREKAWQFKDMQKNGLRPTLKTEEETGLSSPGNTPIPISDPVLMTEATSSPRYPTKAFRW